MVTIVVAVLIAWVIISFLGGMAQGYQEMGGLTEVARAQVVRLEDQKIAECNASLARKGKPPMTVEEENMFVRGKL